MASHIKLDPAEEALFSRNHWDSCAADEVLSVIKHGLKHDIYRSGLMEVHFHLAYHFAHDENRSHDFCARHGVKSVLHIQRLVTRAAA